MNDKLTLLAKKIRENSLNMVAKVNASHIGSALSCVEILSFLYGEYLHYDSKVPSLSNRDRFILSKGHAAASLYATLSEVGYFPSEWLDNYCCDGGKLAGHATHTSAPGVEVSTGSLGHGLPIGAGLALYAKRTQQNHRVCVLLSDGECDEGSNWESFLFAPAHQLGNLIVVIDYNKIQSFGSIDEIIPLEPLGDKLRAMRWHVQEINGHDFNEIRSAFTLCAEDPNKPHVIIAHTIKGKGVSFMEGKLAWHYKSPNKEELQSALEEVRGGLK